jgi:ssDNA-binding Zn-finger/Zn-ribbon topoisomerase 1
MQLRKVEHPGGKSFYWACNGPDCPYESEEIQYTMDNYHDAPPLVCPRCGRRGNLMSEGIPAVPQPTGMPRGLTEKVGEAGQHPDME